MVRAINNKSADQPLVVTLVLEATDEGPYQGQRFEYAMMSLAGGVLPQCIVIGSDEDECQCVLDQDDEVSGEHAMISLGVDADGMPVFCYTDTDSTNGSEVNAAAVAPEVPVTLASGDMIKVGETVLRFSSSVAAEDDEAGPDGSDEGFKGGGAVLP
jgi:hypothetical protein